MVLQPLGNSGRHLFFRAVCAAPYMVQAADETVPEGIDLCGHDHFDRLDDTENAQGFRKSDALL